MRTKWWLAAAGEKPGNPTKFMKLDKDFIRNKNRSISLRNTDAKIFNKILANQIHQYTKSIHQYYETIM